MAFQFDDACRNAAADALESAVGTSPVVKLFNGTIPANCAAADTGTVLAQGGPTGDWMAAASGGSKSLTGTFTVTGQAGAGAGTIATHFRLYSTGGTVCRHQGLCGGQVQIPTTALTAVNGNVLTFSSTSGIAVGMRVSGTGILADTFAIAVTGTTVTLSRSSTAGVSNGASITFNYDMTLDNATIANLQVVTVQSYNLTTGGG